MRTKVLYMLALLLVLSVGQAEAQRILPRMQGVEMRGGMASDNGYYMGMILSSYAKGGNKWVYGADYLHMKHGYRHVTILRAVYGRRRILPEYPFRCGKSVLPQSGRIGTGWI